MIRNYLTIAFRTLKRNTAYTTINVVGLSLGIACSLIIFMVVKHHISFDTFHADAGRIYRLVTEKHRDQVSYTQSVPAPLGRAFREDYTFAEQVARICTYDEPQITINRNGYDDKFRELEVAFAETAFFDIFNYPLLQGTLPVNPNTAVVTENIAKKYFGNESPFGKTFRFQNQLDFTITGILKNLPTNTDRQTEIYLSYGTLPLYDDFLGSEDAWDGISSQMQCFAKLKPGVTVKEVEAVLPAYAEKYTSGGKKVFHYKLQPLNEIHFDGRYSGVMEKRNLWVLACIGIFVVVTGCVNFVNLATAQAINRSKEVGVRKSLGGRRFQFFWQFISETTIITLIAIVLAFVIAYSLLPAINKFFDIQLAAGMFSNVQLIGFMIGLAVIVTFLSGSYPGLILSGFQPVQALKGKLMEVKGGSFSTRRSLVVMQFIISQVLIIGLIVVVTQLRYAQNSDLGFRKDAIVMVPLGSADSKSKSHVLKARIAALSGVEQASLCTTSPASNNNWNTDLRYDSRTEDELFTALYRGGDEEYVKTFDLELVAGRNLEPSDTLREFLVNETFVSKLGLSSPEEILGRTIAVNGGHWKAPVVGVVKDFHDQSFHKAIHPVFITTKAYEAVAVRIQPTNMKETLKAIEQVWTELYPEQIYEHTFLDDDIKKFYETEATMLNLVQAFAAIAIFIGCMGLYGLMSFMAVQKTKEIGIRKVLGGSIGNILWLFGKEFTVLIMFAFVVAAPVAWWLMNAWLKDFQFKITLGPWIFATAILSTATITLLTVSWQSWRAASVNPTKSLRSE